jgi:predicted AlkP superfamily pyrophosphatase or phosphodiesterase
MAKKVVLFLVDGMRPDALAMADTPVMDRMRARGCYSLEAQTVMPSVTLPCHFSLFFSLPPLRHGILTNTFTPMARPVPGLIDVLHKDDLIAASFTNWEQLRDLSSPGALAVSLMMSNLHQPVGDADLELTRAAIQWLTSHTWDFCFIYLGQTDEVGHASGWMGADYLASVAAADRCMGMVLDVLGADVNVFVTADHGGHDRMHGTPEAEDMTIPVLAAGPEVPALGALAGEVSIMDIAPTIAKLMGSKAPRQWSGSPLF